MTPQPNKDFSTRLVDVLQMQLHQVSEYIEYLNQIKRVITQGDADQLNQMLSQQPVEISHIEQTRQQQAELLDQFGYQNSDTGLQDYLKDYPQQPIKELQASLGKQIKKLEKSLLINDLLIRKNQHRVRQTLQILAGHGASDNAVTYSRQGNTDRQDNNKRTIALA